MVGGRGTDLDSAEAVAPGDVVHPGKEDTLSSGTCTSRTCPSPPPPPPPWTPPSRSAMGSEDARGGIRMTVTPSGRQHRKDLIEKKQILMEAKIKMKIKKMKKKRIRKMRKQVRKNQERRNRKPIKLMVLKSRKKCHLSQKVYLFLGNPIFT